MYQVDVLIQGFPGRAVCHGGLGWSTITLMRSKDRVILLDVGAFGVRKPLAKQLKIHGVDPSDVTDVILTHAHYDHSINFTLFPSATIRIGDVELNWAANEPPGFNPLPELYVRELVQSSRVKRIHDGDRFLPGFVALASPGHTPGHLIFVMDGNEVPVVLRVTLPKTALSCYLLMWVIQKTMKKALKRSNSFGNVGVQSRGPC